MSKFRCLVLGVCLMHFGEAIGFPGPEPTQLGSAGEGDLSDRWIFAPRRVYPQFIPQRIPQETWSQSSLYKQPQGSQIKPQKPSQEAGTKSQIRPQILPQKLMPQSMQNRPKKPNRHGNNLDPPKIDIDVNIAIKPYFIGPQYLPVDGPKNGPDGTFQFEFKETQSGAPQETRQESVDTSIQIVVDDDDPIPSTKRPKRIPSLNIKASIGDFSLNLRIEDVNQIWGYADVDRSENPFGATENKENGENEYVSTYNGVDASTNKYNHTAVTTESSLETTTFDFNKWLEEKTANESKLDFGSLPALPIKVDPSPYIGTSNGADVSSNGLNHPAVSGSNLGTPTSTTESSVEKTTFDLGGWIDEKTKNDSYPGIGSPYGLPTKLDPSTSIDTSDGDKSEGEDYSHYGIELLDAILAQNQNIESTTKPKAADEQPENDNNNVNDHGTGSENKDYLNYTLKELDAFLAQKLNESIHKHRANENDHLNVESTTQPKAPFDSNETTEHKNVNNHGTYHVDHEDQSKPYDKEYQDLFTVPEENYTDKVLYPGPKQSDVDERLGTIKENVPPMPNSQISDDRLVFAD